MFFVFLISVNLPQDVIYTEESPAKTPSPPIEWGRGPGRGGFRRLLTLSLPSPSREREFAED